MYSAFPPVLCPVVVPKTRSPFLKSVTAFPVFLHLTRHLHPPDILGTKPKQGKEDFLQELGDSAQFHIPDGHRPGVNFDQDLIRLWSGFWHLLERKDFRRTGFGKDDGFHFVSPMVMITFPFFRARFGVSMRFSSLLHGKDFIDDRFVFTCFG